MSETAKIFREMQSSDHIRDSMKQGILERAYTWLGDLYGKGQEMFQDSGLQGALHDIYRRVFEQGYFGRDIYDGRYMQDHGLYGQGNPGQSYDTRAEFYGLDKAQDAQAQNREQEHGLEVDDDRER